MKFWRDSFQIQKWAICTRDDAKVVRRLDVWSEKCYVCESVFLSGEDHCILSDRNLSFIKFFADDTSGRNYCIRSTYRLRFSIRSIHRFELTTLVVDYGYLFREERYFHKNDKLYNCVIDNVFIYLCIILFIYYLIIFSTLYKKQRKYFAPTKISMGWKYKNFIHYLFNHKYYYSMLANKLFKIKLKIWKDFLHFLHTLLYGIQNTLLHDMKYP